MDEFDEMDMHIIDEMIEQSEAQIYGGREKFRFSTDPQKWERLMEELGYEEPA